MLKRCDFAVGQLHATKDFELGHMPILVDVGEMNAGCTIVVDERMIKCDTEFSLCHLLHTLFEVGIAHLFAVKIKGGIVGKIRGQAFHVTSFYQVTKHI